MAQHTDTEVIARRGVSVVLGGVRKDVPALVIEKSEEWQALFASRVGQLWGSVGSDPNASWPDMVGVVASSIPVMIELIVAYDAEGHTGGLEWIRKNATPEEVYEAFKGVAAAAFPFARDLARFPALIQQLLGQLSGSSTSSPSPASGSTTAPS